MSFLDDSISARHTIMHRDVSCDQPTGSYQREGVYKPGIVQTRASVGQRRLGTRTSHMANKLQKISLDSRTIPCSSPVASATDSCKRRWCGTCWARRRECHLTESEVQIVPFSREFAASALIGNGASSAIGKPNGGDIEGNVTSGIGLRRLQRMSPKPPKITPQLRILILRALHELTLLLD